MSEDVLDRGDAPAGRAVNPLWKWAFLATILVVGAGALAFVLRLELQPPPDPDSGGEERPRLRFSVGEYPVPSFAPPTPVTPALVSEPAPEPESISVATPEPPPVPQLPRPEPHDGYRPPFALPPPQPVPIEPAPVEPAEDPVELARQRRLAAPLSGTGGGTGGGNGRTAGMEEQSSGDIGGVGGRDRGGLDLTTSRITTAVADRLADMTFILPQGTSIGCTLETAIQSDQAGLVSCTLPRDVYGADGTLVLLDRGSRVLGEYRSATLTYGKRRLFVVWNRVRTPTGVVVDLASPGTGPLGQAGMGGRIDNHYWERVGIPVLMSAVSFGAESYAREELTSDEAQYIETTTDDSLSSVLAELARIKPTLHKHQGAAINILVARDVDLSSVYALRVRNGG